MSSAASHSVALRAGRRRPPPRAASPRTSGASTRAGRLPSSPANQDRARGPQAPPPRREHPFRSSPRSANHRRHKGARAVASAKLSQNDGVSAREAGGATHRLVAPWRKPPHRRAPGVAYLRDEGGKRNQHRGSPGGRETLRRPTRGGASAPSVGSRAVCRGRAPVPTSTRAGRGRCLRLQLAAARRLWPLPSRPPRDHASCRRSPARRRRENRRADATRAYSRQRRAARLGSQGHDSIAGCQR
jgi:hypothetical protein